MNTNEEENNNTLFKNESSFCLIASKIKIINAAKKYRIIRTVKLSARGSNK